MNTASGEPSPLNLIPAPTKNTTEKRNVMFIRNTYQLTLALLLFATVAMAAPTACPTQYAGGQAPDLINQKLSTKTREVCYTEYGLLHSGITRTPLYSAEHLTRTQLQQAKEMVRNSKFFPDPHIPRNERSELRHYSKSGYDRGHMAPSADMPDAKSQQECFSLANIVPQDPKINRGVWEGIEWSVRQLALTRGELYVVTGPVYVGENLQRIGGAVMVPTQLFKAVYDPDEREAGAYVVDNVTGAKPRMISIKELQQLTGIDVFPAVSAEVKEQAMSLPKPKTYRQRHQTGGN
jgi:endonuclease G